MFQMPQQISQTKERNELSGKVKLITFEAGIFQGFILRPLFLLICLYQ